MECATAKWMSVALGKSVRSPSFWLITVLLAYMAYVSTYNDRNQPAFTVIVRDSTDSLEDFFLGTTARDLKAVDQFALLSADVYKKKKPPEYLCNEATSLSGWKRWERAGFHYLPTRPAGARDWYGNFADGLDFEIYSRATPNDQGEWLVAIAFQSTKNEFSDIWSNLHWVTRWVPFTYDQYDLVRTIAPELVGRIDNHEDFKGKPVRIVATGHSLGGGLAHQAAYAADRIETVYAFDSSSVTGFYDVERQDQDRRAQRLRIYRIYERGEILAYLRRFMAQIYPVVAKDPKIVEARYNFEGLRGSFINLHGMENLACNLHKITVVQPEKVGSPPGS